MHYLEQAPEFNRIVGNRIKECIRESKYGNMERFCLRFKIPKSTMSELLNGKNDVKLSTIAKIAGALDLKISQIFRDFLIDTWVEEDAKKWIPQKTPKKKKIQLDSSIRAKIEKETDLFDYLKRKKN